MKKLTYAESVARCRAVAKALEAEGRYAEAANFWEAVRIGRTGVFKGPVKRDWLFVDGQSTPRSDE